MDETPITTPMEAPTTSPHTEVAISPNGMAVKITAQGLKIEFSFGEADMNNIAGHWLETRREIRQQLEVAEKGK